ncbi:MAG: DUF3127 domain-containing protein [Gammaproteobacteria bacterium]|nr:DUF3127 domain-containing protein [Gammaproteobacteria bacterium]
MSKGYQAEGTLRAILDTEQVNDSFRKREFAVEIEDGKYPQTIKFQTVQDRTEMLDDYRVGQPVRVHFDLRGREFTRKRDGTTDWWVNLDCWRLEALDGASAASPGEASQPAEDGAADFDDEIPF